MSYDNPDWYNQLEKSPLNPPSWVFGVVWPILYLTLAWSFYRHYQLRPVGNNAWIVFMLQIVLNIGWSRIFFTLKNPKLALVWILLMILLTLLTIFLFYPIDPLSAWILIPYLLWLCFASYLNLYIVQNNK
jgi:tryptophan-rich sensory protein